MRKKSQWEDRIKKLGGPDYKHGVKDSIDSLSLSNENGYKYFGAAKNLPQVKEHLQKEIPQAPLENKRNLHIVVDREYLGHVEISQTMLENEKKFE